MDRFLSLPIEKQEKILNAGFRVFGCLGYRKASTSDIAAEACISKGMIFHYFGNKKQMYLFLVKEAAKELEKALKEGAEQESDDFFDRILLGTTIKLRVIRKYPDLLKFFMSVYREQDGEVAGELKTLFQNTEGVRNAFLFTGLDRSKFKEGIDPELVLTILIRYSLGYVYGVPSDQDLDCDAILKEFESSLLLMKHNFYREEFV